jgi:hypothetical protein
VATIANVGDGDASEAFHVQFKVDDLAIARQRVRQLRAGRTVEVQAEWEAIEGEHRVTVEADPADAVQESNERNNTLQVLLTVRRRAAIYSLTDEITLTIGRSLRLTGEGLGFAIGADFAAALAEGLKRLEEARLTLSGAGSKLLQIADGLPSPLAGEPIARGGRAVGELFLAMASSLGRLAPALQGLNLEAGLAVLREIEAELVALSRLEFERVRLGPLASAAQHLEEAVEVVLALGGEPLRLELRAGHRGADLPTPDGPGPGRERWSSPSERLSRGWPRTAGSSSVTRRADSQWSIVPGSPSRSGSTARSGWPSRSIALRAS